MGIIFLTESIIEYISISSILLFILGLLSFITVQSMKIQGKAKLWVCTLIIILPLVYPLKTLFPESAKIPVRVELNLFQQKSEISAEKTFSADASFFSNSGTAAGEPRKSDALLTGNEALGPGIKNRFVETISVFFGNWRLIAAILWGGVFLFSLVRVAVTGYRINKFLRLADPVTNPNILKLLQQCVSDTGLRRSPKLFMIDGISTPMVMGFFTPVIIIPGHLLKQEFREGLRFTLLHELKHLQQHHNWWLLIESIIGAAYFFHPVFHWAKRKIHEELELICDSHVIHVTDKSVSYADFLLNEIWQQSSGKKPSLALPFISNVSKTATRIHSILGNARPKPLTHIRDRISVFFVLMVFPSILLISISPPVPNSDQTLNILNPSKVYSQEGKDYKSDLARQKEDISLIDNSLITPSSEVTAYKEKTVGPLLKADNTESPAKVIRETTAFEPVSEIKSKSIGMAKEESPAESIEESSSLDPVQIFDMLNIVPGNNIYWAQSGTGTGETSDNSITPINIVEKYLGSPVNELAINRIDNIKVLDEFTVLFIMRGGNMYLTRLSDPCPSLLYVSDYNLVSINGRLSKFGRIQAISGNQVIGTSGMLGAFYPYIYEGNKYEAINLFKKSLLTELVNQGAFKDFNPTKD